MTYEIEADESVSVAVARAVSAVNGCKPESLPPLVTIVDPDALDALVADRPGGKPRRGARVSFVYAGHRVTVDNGEYITVAPVDRGARTDP